jgi:hypothetical protein
MPTVPFFGFSLAMERDGFQLCHFRRAENWLFLQTIEAQFGLFDKLLMDGAKLDLHK